MKKNNKKGFTLVELVIVVAVMAILVAIAIPTVGAITDSAKKAVYGSNCNTIQSMIKLGQANAAKAGDGAGAISDTAIQKYLEDAKLGIKAGSDATQSTFYFHEGTGLVDNTATAVGSEKVYTIVYDANGAVKVTGGK